MKYVSIDTETTGLNPERCQVIEFGAVIDDLSNPQPIVKLPKFQCYIRYPEYKGSAFALQMNQKILKTLATDHEDDPIIDAIDLAEFFEHFQPHILFLPLTHKIRLIFCNNERTHLLVRIWSLFSLAYILSVYLRRYQAITFPSQ